MIPSSKPDIPDIYLLCQEIYLVLLVKAVRLNVSQAKGNTVKPAYNEPGYNER